MGKTANAILVSTFLILALVANADSTPALLKRAENGNLKALNQAYLLLSKTDGGGSEAVSIAIGKSILKNPRNFLLALKKNRSKEKRLDATLGGLGEKFVDDFKKQKLELERRLKAIQTVDDETLKSVRAECEKELNRQIQERSREQ